MNEIKKILNQFPEVRWDRYTEQKYPDGTGLEFYGWIERDDGKFDFLEIYFFNNKPEWIATSSKKYSLGFHLRLGFPENEHLGCKRVEWIFPDINCIKLNLK